MGRFKQKISIMLSAVIILLSLSACTVSQSEKVSKSDFVLDTVATITLYDSTDMALIDECFELCRHYESLFSRTDEESEIYKLNQREISELSPETAALISESLYYSELSDGAFDITVEPLSSLWNFKADFPSVPAAADIEAACQKISYKAVSVSGSTVQISNDYARIDLGAIAKGYIADRVKELLLSRGIEKAIVNLGGNVSCIGGISDETGFKIGIQQPFKEGSVIAVTVSGLSVVTSGTYERYFEEGGKLYHHILNPKTGYPYDNGLLSVSIIGETSSVCDALSTTCFALGREAGKDLIESMDGYYGIFIADDYSLLFTKGAEEALSIEY